jgi:outer membrane biosynthesis protein TonB
MSAGKLFIVGFAKEGIYDKFLVIIKLPQTLLENCMTSRIARFSLISLVSAAISLTPMAVFAADPAPAPAPAPAAAPVSAPVAAPTPAEPSSTKAAEKKAKKQSKKQKKAKKKSKKKAKPAADAAVQ